MAKLNLNYELLPAKLHYFAYYGALGALWPFIPVIARQWGMSAWSVGWIFSLAALCGAVLAPLVNRLSSQFRLRKLTFLLFLTLNIFSFIGLAALPNNSPTDKSTHFDRPVELACDETTPRMQLYLRQCQSTEPSSPSCYSQELREKYFEIGSDEEDWSSANEKLTKDLTFEKCDVRCSLKNQNIDVCDLFDEPENCLSNSRSNSPKGKSRSQSKKFSLVEKRGNVTFIKFEMRIEVASIVQNSSCLHLPLDLISFDNKRLMTACPSTGGAQSTKSSEAIIMPDCFVNCRKSKAINALLESHELENNKTFKMDHNTDEFWAFAILVCTSVTCIAIVSLLADGITFDLLNMGRPTKHSGIRRINEISDFAFVRLWGVIGGGAFAILVGYLMDYDSEGKAVKDIEKCFYISLGLLVLDWAIAVNLKVNEQLRQDLFPEAFKKVLKEPIEIIFLSACFLVGFFGGLQSTFQFWFMEEIADDIDNSEDKCAWIEWMRLAQGTVVLVECFIGTLPFYLAARSLIWAVDELYCIVIALGAIGLRCLLMSFVENPWVIVPFSLFQGVTSGLFDLMVISHCHNFLRGQLQYKNARLVDFLILPLTAKGLGISFGNIIAGVIVDEESSEKAFRGFGITALSLAVLYGAVVVVLKMCFETVISKSSLYSPAEEIDCEKEEREGMFENGIEKEGEKEWKRKDSKPETIRSCSTVSEWRKASPTTAMKKFKLLLWKNFKLQTRHKIQTVIEIIIPLFFTITLCVIRILTPADKIPENTIFEAFPLKGNVPPVMQHMTNEIYYNPSNPFYDKIMAKVNEDHFMALGLNYTFVSFQNEEKMVQAYEDSMEGFSIGEGSTDVTVTAYNATAKVLAGITFDKLTGSKLPKEIKYTIRLPAYQRTEFELFAERFTFKPAWYTEVIYPIFRLLGPRSDKPNGGFPGYFAEGFLYLQYAIESTLTKSFLSESQKKEYDDYQIKMQRFPYPPYTDDKFIFAIQFWMPFFIALSFIYPCMNITKVIVYEKECRLKEFMKMMGLPNWLHWTAWFIKAFLFLLASVILMTILLKIQFEEGKAVLTKSNILIIFAVFICHSISIIGFCFFMSTLFSTANNAATAAGFMWLVFFLPYGYMFPRVNTMSRATKYLSCFILGNIPISHACQILSSFEGSADGMQWDLIDKGITPDDSFCLLDCMIMMVVNGLFFMVSAFYIELAWPGKYGVPFPWYFPFTKWYWTDGVPMDKVPDELSRTPSKSSKKSQGSSNYFEVDPLHSIPGINIKGLTKIFGEKTAVNGVNLKMFENQITALLGHNGAGKTTTMSMLTGLLTPTRGTALVNDHDICTEMNSVRANLGMCPQYDVLFDELTVEEHLKFFSLLKGYDELEADAEVERMLQLLGFEAKREAQAHTLSGGMKRKLSVAIAFCAGSRAVLLDEPTSGMDPGARRSTWDLIQTEKLGRTVVLSTHFMEEADLLGDRIAIMAEGEVQCCGSSLFLKKKYGGDYRLIIVKEPQCRAEEITTVLKTKIPSVQVSQDVGAELSYSLPDDSSKDFPALFEELENKKTDLGIASYGVGNTTMEEVFMRVGEASHHGLSHGKERDSLKSSKSRNTMKKSQSKASQLSRSKSVGSFQAGGTKVTSDPEGNVEERKLLKFASDGARNSGSELKWQQLKAMIVKKILFSLRNRSLMLLQIGIPVVVVLMVTFNIKNFPTLLAPKPHLITLDRYEALGETITAISCEQNTPICNGYRSFVSDNYNIEEIHQDTFVDYMLEKETEDLAKTNSIYMIGFEERQVSRKRTELTAFFNNQPLHTPPLTLNYLTNAILRSFDIPHRITVTNHPFDYNAIDSLKESGSFMTMGFMIGVGVSLGISFLAASFIIFPIQERVTNAKHLQFVAGIKFPIYWFAAYATDMVNYMVSSVLVMLALIIYDVKMYHEFEVCAIYLLLSVAHGWAQISLMNLLSFAFPIPSSGYARMVAFNAGSGMTCLLAMATLAVPELELEDTTDVLHNLFLFLPNYAFSFGLVQLHTAHDLHGYCGTFDLVHFCQASPEFICCTKYQKSYFDWKPVGLGRNVMSLILFGLICTICVTVIETRIISKVLAMFQWENEWEAALDDEGQEPLDDDVENESQRINSQTLVGLSRTDSLILRNLTKIYDNKFMAVDHLTMGVRHGETFGLLGINGAGKTTTFKMLTGDIPITHGDAYLCTYSVRKKVHKVHENLGYCPQFDAVIEQLTGRETIRMFARLKGIKEECIDGIVDRLGESLLFSQHIEKAVGAYSGGNKRKLSTALAMLGNPAIVFLDEPSTGMDPVARRHVWNAVSGIREMGTSVVITSHSMEECEALCSKLSIMVNGRFRCLGSPQHLKNKFGEGYTIVAQLSYTGMQNNLNQADSPDEYDEDEEEFCEPWELELAALKNFIETEFSDCELKDSHPGFVQYHVSSESGTWAKLFAVMERAKEQFNLEAYSVGQTSLEQVFFNFTKIQRPTDD